MANKIEFDTEFSIEPDTNVSAEPEKASSEAMPGIQFDQEFTMEDTQDFSIEPPTTIKAEMTLKDNPVTGVTETFLQGVSGLAGASLGALSGAVAATASWLDNDDATDPSDAYMSVFQETSQALTYKPATVHGKYLEALASKPFEYMAEKGQQFGDSTFEGTDSVAAAAAVRTLTEGSIYVLPYFGQKGYSKYKAKQEAKVAKEYFESARARERADVQAEAETYKPQVLSLDEFKELKRLDDKNAPDSVLDAAYDDYAANVTFQAAQNARSKAIPFKSSEDIPEVAKPSQIDVQKDLETIPFDSTPETSLTAKPIGSLLPEQTKTEIPVVDAEYSPTTLTKEQFQSSPFGMDAKTGKPLGSKALSAAYDTYVSKRLSGTSDIKLAKVPAHIKPDDLMVEVGYLVREQERQQQKIQQEELAWQQQKLDTHEARIESMLANLSGEPVNTTRGKLGNKFKGQQGSVSPKVFAEGLYKAGMGVKDFTNAIVKDLGEAYRPYALALYQHAKVVAESGAAEQTKIAKQPSAFDEVPAIPQRMEMSVAKIAMNEVAGGKSISLLRQSRANSPAWRQLIDSIRRPEAHQMIGTERRGPDYGEAVQLESGKYQVRLSEIIDTVQPTRYAGELIGKRLPDNANAKLASLLRQKEPVVGTDKISKAALQIRGLFDDVYKYAEASGIKVAKYLDGYLPRVWKAKVLQESSKLREGLKSVLVNKGGIKPNDADIFIEEIVANDGIMLEGAQNGSWRSIIGKGGNTKQRSLEMHRALANISDEDLAPYLESDVYALTSKYIETAVRRAEYARRFGPNEEKITSLVQQAIKESTAAGKPITGTELKRLSTELDMINHKFMKIQSPTVNKIQRAGITVSNLALLPLVTIGSMAEIVIPFSRAGIKASAKAMPKAILAMANSTARGIYKGIPKTEALRSAELMHKALDISTTERLTSLFAGETNAINNLAFKAFLLNSWTRFVNVFAAESFKYMLTDYLKAEAKQLGRSRAKWGNKSGSRLEGLMQYYGVDTLKGIEWAKQGAKPEGEFYDTYVRAGALRFAEDSVLTPKATDLPVWHSIPHLAMIAHLKRYPTLMGNTVLKQWYFDTVGELQKGNVTTSARNMTYVAGTMSLGLLVATLSNQILDLIRYGSEGNPRRKDDTPVDTALHSMDRAGYFGVASILRDAAIAHTYGSTPLASLAGPTAGGLSDAVKATAVAVDNNNPKALAKVLARYTPLSSANKEMQHSVAEFWVNTYRSIFGTDVKKKEKGKTKRLSRHARPTRNRD